MANSCQVIRRDGGVFIVDDGTIYMNWAFLAHNLGIAPDFTVTYDITDMKSADAIYALLQGHEPHFFYVKSTDACRCLEIALAKPKFQARAAEFKPKLIELLASIRLKTFPRGFTADNPSDKLQASD